MKQVMIKSTMITAIALMATSNFASAFTVAPAQSFISYAAGNSVEFKYLGTTNDQPVFQLNLNNNELAEFVVTLKDHSGNVLYTETVSGKQISRRYRLDTDEIDANDIKVEVSNRKDNSKTVYTINRNRRVVEDVVINKL